MSSSSFLLTCKDRSKEILPVKEGSLEAKIGILEAREDSLKVKASNLEIKEGNPEAKASSLKVKASNLEVKIGPETRHQEEVAIEGKEISRQAEFALKLKREFLKS